jgi:hypothetical protein
MTQNGHDRRILKTKLYKEWYCEGDEKGLSDVQLFHGY